MKKFEEPVLNLEKFEIEDVVTASGEGNPCPYDAGEFSLR